MLVWGRVVEDGPNAVACRRQHLAEAKRQSANVGAL